MALVLLNVFRLVLTCRLTFLQGTDIAFTFQWLDMQIIYSQIRYDLLRSRL